HARERARRRRALYPYASCRLTLIDRHVIALGSAGVELARTADLLVGVGDHLIPLRDPAYRSSEREQRREHVGREADRIEDHAGIEIDVRVELLLDEIIVADCDPLELLG